MRFLTIFMTIFLFATLSAQVNPDSGLVGYWPFNGNALDESGNNNNGTPNGAILVADRFENDSSAYKFDGVDDYIAVPSSGSLSLSQITISTWIRLSDSIGFTQVRIICRQETNPGQESWGLEIFGADYGGSGPGNNLAFHANDGVSTKNIVSATNLEIDTWYHVVAINDGDSLFLFINANQDTSLSSLGNVSSNNNGPVHIGKTNPSDAFHFPGSIDDIRLYNRALTVEEINYLYGGTINSIGITDLNSPENFNLEQNFPNPFNPLTVISYSIPKNSFVSLKVYDSLGKEVQTLVAEYQVSGPHTIKFDAKHLASGVYIYTVQVGSLIATKKMLLLK